jgi:HSP20 family protein
MARDSIRHRQAFFLPAARGCEEVLWRPSVDVYRTTTGWLLKFDLAGVPPEEVTLEASGQRLTVKGRRRDWALEQGHRYYRMEICYTEFERTVELPCRLDPARIATDYRLGMLLVRVDAGEEDK